MFYIFRPKLKVENMSEAVGVSSNLQRKGSWTLQ